MARKKIHLIRGWISGTSWERIKACIAVSRLTADMQPRILAFLMTKPPRECPISIIGDYSFVSYVMTRRRKQSYFFSVS